MRARKRCLSDERREKPKAMMESSCIVLDARLKNSDLLACPVASEKVAAGVAVFSREAHVVLIDVACHGGTWEEAESFRVFF